jgi:hypothetical protein
MMGKKFFSEEVNKVQDLGRVSSRQKYWFHQLLVYFCKVQNIPQKLQ